MTISEILKKYPNIEIELLLAYVLKKPREFVFMNGEKRLSAYQLTRLLALVKRRLRGEPIAYILGYKDFYGLRFKVNKNVLIPRPETEWLVDRVIARIRQLAETKQSRLPHPSEALGVRNDKIRILDLATGSGCIAISIAKQLQISNVQYQISASDISKKALVVARQNAKVHKVKVTVKLSNILENVGKDFDIIVANLPYVPKKNYKLRMKNLEWEPKIALVDPKKDFNLYEKFFQQVGQHITTQSRILLEMDPTTKFPIQKFVKKYLRGWKVKFFKDYNGLWRYAEITYNF